jgi:uncharacterized membrane protein YadS
LISLPGVVISGAAMTSKVLLVIALFCIGTEISRNTLRELRGAVLIHGLLLWALVVPLTLFMVTQLV